MQTASTNLEKLNSPPLVQLDEALRMIGETHLEMAKGCGEGNNLPQALHCCDLALISLKKLHARPLEVIEIIDTAMGNKFNVLNLMGKKKEALACAEERYSLWACGFMRNQCMLFAAFPLIESLIHDIQFEQASLIAHTAYDMILNDTDGIIADNHRQKFIAEGSNLLALATYRLAESGGIPSAAEKKKAGEEAIVLARKSVDLYTRLHGSESNELAVSFSTLAHCLKFFDDLNNDDGNEIFRLYEKSITMFSRVQGSQSPNVAAASKNLGAMYEKRAMKAHANNDLDRCITNLELALPHFRKGERIYRENNFMDAANKATQAIVHTETELRYWKAARTAATVTKK